MFWADYRGNRQSIEILRKTIREHKNAVLSGREKVRVLGFCSSYGTVGENLAVAKNRSNQVKSYYIVHEGLKEEHFYTTNSASTWNDDSDIIAIAFIIESAQFAEVKEESGAVVPDDEVKPAAPDGVMAPAAPDDGIASENPDEMKPAVPEETTPAVNGKNEGGSAGDLEMMTECRHRNRFAVKTNVAYLAATVANIGVEYSFGEHYSIAVSFIFSPYRISRIYTLKFMAVQPEFRYWLKTPMEGHFFGAHASIGAFNLSVNSDMRYQSPDGFYGVGISYGYMLPFAKKWAAEFTIGAGYVYTEYDSYYNIDNGARYRHNVSHNYWGLTRVGAGLVYKFGK